MIYLDLFLTFLKIGTFTFGGGYAMIPLIQEEVIKHGWMSMEELINFIAVSESTPGPFAINIATFVGNTTAGLLGAVLCTLGVILTSFIIILIIFKFFDKYQNNKFVKGCMNGLRPAVVGLIGAAVITTFISVFFLEGEVIGVIKSSSFYEMLVILGATLIMSIKKIHPIIIVLVSALFGIIVGCI